MGLLPTTLDQSEKPSRPTLSSTALPAEDPHLLQGPKAGSSPLRNPAVAVSLLPAIQTTIDNLRAEAVGQIAAEAIAGFLIPDPIAKFGSTTRLGVLVRNLLLVTAPGSKNITLAKWAPPIVEAVVTSTGLRDAGSHAGNLIRAAAVRLLSERAY